jgi:hypothetical protein
MTVFHDHDFSKYFASMLARFSSHLRANKKYSGTVREEGSVRLFGVVLGYLVVTL